MTATPASADLVAEVSDLLVTYGSAVDLKDIDALAAVLAPDVRLSRPDGTREGSAAFLDFYQSVFDGPATMRHYVTNLRVTEDGDDLRVAAYFQAWNFLPETTRVVTGRYDDVVRRVDGRLMIAHKTNVIEYVVDLPAATPA